MERTADESSIHRLFRNSTTLPIGYPTDCRFSHGAIGDGSCAGSTCSISRSLAGHSYFPLHFPKNIPLGRFGYAHGQRLDLACGLITRAKAQGKIPIESCLTWDMSPAFQAAWTAKPDSSAISSSLDRSCRRYRHTKMKIPHFSAAISVVRFPYDTLAAPFVFIESNPALPLTGLNPLRSLRLITANSEPSPRASVNARPLREAGPDRSPPKGV